MKSYKVYLRHQKETKKLLLAQFLEQVDAVNFAYDQSTGKYRYHFDTIIVITPNGIVFTRLTNGLPQ